MYLSWRKKEMRGTVSIIITVPVMLKFQQSSMILQSTVTICHHYEPEQSHWWLRYSDFNDCWKLGQRLHSTCSFSLSFLPLSLQASVLGSRRSRRAQSAQVPSRYLVFNPSTELYNALYSSGMEAPTIIAWSRIRCPGNKLHPLFALQTRVSVWPQCSTRISVCDFNQDRT